MRVVRKDRAVKDTRVYEVDSSGRLVVPMRKVEPDWQTCRDCGRRFTYSADADRCPECVVENVIHPDIGG